MINLFHPFTYNKSVYGGTEYMARTFLELVYPKLKKLNEYICVVMPGHMPPLSVLVEDKRKVIAWIHNTPKQFNPAFYNILANPVFLEKIAYIVVPSQAAKAMFIRDVPAISADKIYVINNAIFPYEYNPDRFKNVDRVDVIHTSDPSRGMPLLVDTVPKVESNIRVNIFNDFNPDLIPDFKADPRIKFYNRTPRATVKSAMEEAHIFAYPSVFEETFCLSIVEAMSAGVLPVYPDIGSLAEMADGLGVMYKYEPDPVKHQAVFLEKFNDAIDFIKSGKWDAEEQVRYIRSAYSWDAIERQWKEFEAHL